jgi:hypothetical protein
MLYGFPMLSELRSAAPGHLAEARLLRDALNALAAWLPDGWSVRDSSALHAGGDARWVIAAPDLRDVSLLVDAKGAIEPRAAARLIERLRGHAGAPWLIVARYISVAARAAFADAKVSYLDLTGNVDIRIADPGLVIRADGLAKDPTRTARAVSSLRGARLAAIVRDLIEHRRPGTLREIGGRVGADIGYLSRVLAFLDEQALITRSPRGELLDVAWPALLERWATDAPMGSRGAPSRYLAPRGLDEFARRLASTTGYAVTGSRAAAQVAPIAPSRLARVYAADGRALAAATGLRAADAGANVVVIEVDDAWPLAAGARPDWHGHRDGLRYASPVNVAADLLSGSGREPDEGGALIEWMQHHEEEWRV